MAYKLTIVFQRKLTFSTCRPTISKEVDRLRTKGTEGRAMEKVFIGCLGGRRARWSPRRKWIDDIDEDWRTLGVRRWRRREDEWV